MTPSCRKLLAACLAGIPLLLASCRTQAPRIRLEPLSMAAAAGIVNDNNARIRGTLRATGSADGYFTTSGGRRRSFHADATLFYLSPRYLRFDLKKFGERQVLFGSNQEWFWFYSRQDGEFVCGRHDDTEELPADLPIRPDQVIDALGLRPIPLDSIANEVVQRVEDDHQQLLFIIRDARGRPLMHKEQWLDRYEPRLVRRVVFRNREGLIEMQAELGRYERFDSDGPLLPTSMTTSWPTSAARLHFQVDRWTIHDQIAPESIQFATPPECYDQETTAR